MATKYVLEYRDHDDSDFSGRRTVRRARMLVAVATFLASGKTWTARIRQRGERFVDKPWLAVPEIRRRVRRRTAFNDAGYKIFIQRRRDRRVLSIHKIEVVPPVPDLGCEPHIEEAYAALRRRYGADGIADGGIYNCRRVEGSSTVSYHGYRSSSWRGAAGDIFSRPDTMEALIARAEFLAAECIAGRLDLDRIIVADRSWRPGMGARIGTWERYSGVFHRHIHIEKHAGFPCM